jgi:hypothetical protein
MKLGYEISLITTSDQERYSLLHIQPTHILTRASLTAVSSGAIIRALDPSGGPERKARCSYGFVSLQLYDPAYDRHQNAKVEVDPFDGKKYVRVINYFVFKVDQPHRIPPQPDSNQLSG